MNVLEKILEEINEKIKFAERMMVKKPCDKLDEIANDTAESFISAYEACGEIIRSHMDEVPNCGKCSRREWYQKGFEDGKKDSDWIPLEERLPNQNGVYNVTRLVDDAFISDSAYFDGQDTWHSDNRVNHTRPYLTDIVAWQPLPEPYIKNPK